MKVPYINLIDQHAAIKEELLQAVEEVLDSAHFILGKQVDEFEKAFAELCGVPYAVGVANGTDSLILSLKALGVGPGDDVITAANSFVASASAIALVGATPVLADVRQDLNIDPDDIKRKITSKTKGIIPVHLTGRPADMDPILQIAKDYNLVVVEDAAQAVGARYKGKSVGAFGNCGSFSLHPLKNLSAAGDAGIITTHDETLYNELKQARNLGLLNRDDCGFWSQNSRLDTIQAAMLLVKLKYLDQYTQKRRENAAYYRQHLSGIVTVPMESEFEYNVYHTFVCLCENRDELRRYLADKGVDTKIHYPLPIHQQTAGKTLVTTGVERTNNYSKEMISLPIYPELTQDQLALVVESIKAFYA